MADKNSDYSCGLIDHERYPEVPEGLIDEFNIRLKSAQEAIAQSYGVIAGLSQDYHTIWLCDVETQNIHLFRCTGEGTISSAVQKSLELAEYEKARLNYIERFVHQSDRKRVAEATQIDTVLSKIADGSLYKIDYLRVSEDGSTGYHQMAFALADILSEKEQFVMGFKNVDNSVRKRIELKRTIERQSDIFDVLSRDFLNIYSIRPQTNLIEIIKLEGYVTEGFDKESKELYPYDVMMEKYLENRVYPEDVERLKEELSIDTIKDVLEEQNEYVGSYRALVDGETHYYQYLYVKMQPDEEGEWILAAFKNIDNIIKDAKEKEALKLMSETDLMTGVFNRGAGEKKAAEAIDSGVKGMLCILDVDNFKNINDTYGHLVGDKVLTQIAGALKNAFRKIDIVFRLGGDEFAVFAQNVYDSVVGERIVERFFNCVEEIDIPEIGDYELTASVGAVIIAGKKNRDFETLYKMADSCVYQSKSVKGNAVTFYR